jgi:hypothetical protein
VQAGKGKTPVKRIVGSILKKITAPAPVTVAQARFNKLKQNSLPCHQLIYTSLPQVEVTTEVLLDILEKAQKKNHALQITGLLVFHQGQFMQLLEGGEKEVKALFETIKADPRHTDVEVVLETDGTRCMNTWTMGFCMSESSGSTICNQIFYISIDGTKRTCELLRSGIGQKILKFIAA